MKFKGRDEGSSSGPLQRDQPPQEQNWIETTEAALNSLTDSYYDPAFDSLGYELGQLPLDVTAAQLESVSDHHGNALDTVTEKLSQHILRNFEAFSSGIIEVLQLQASITNADLQAKISRERLAAAAGEIMRSIEIWRSTRRKRKLSDLLEVLLRLQHAVHSSDAMLDALRDGDFCLALSFVAKSAELSAALGQKIRVAESLSVNATDGYETALTQIKSTLGALTTEFQEGPFKAALQAYAFINAIFESSVDDGSDSVDIGRDIYSVFASAPTATTHKVLRGVLLTRPGLENSLAEADGTNDLVALIPSDLFRTCLARVMMMLWDILAAHRTMEEWLLQLSTALANGSDADLCGGVSDETGGVIKKDGDAEYSSAWLPVLESAKSGLRSSERLLWDEACRAVAILIGSPSAVEGEHFLQVVDWTRRFTASGEAFSGVEAVSLKEILQQRAGVFFAAYHEANLEALNSMLEKETWKALPVEMPLQLFELDSENNHMGGGKGGDGQKDSDRKDEFAQMLVLGNPWRNKYGPQSNGSSVHGMRLGFAGATVLDDDHTAGGALDVDERGFHRAGSGDLSQSAQDVSQGGASEPEESPKRDPPVHNDPLLSASVGRKSPESGNNSLQNGSGDCGASGRATTNSSWRMAKWMRDYCVLMRLLPSIAPGIFQGLMDLIELYMLHVYCAFGDFKLLAAPVHTASGMKDVEGLPPGLHATLRHAGLVSLRRYKGLFASGKPESRMLRAVAIMDGSSHLVKATSLHGGHNASPGGVPRPGNLGLHITPIAHSGNLYGLIERFVAADSLRTIAELVVTSAAQLKALLPSADTPVVVSFCGRIKEHAVDLRDAIVLQGCKLMLPVAWVPEALGSGDYQLSEPPSQPGGWTRQLTRQLELFSAQISQTQGLPTDAPTIVWEHATKILSQALVEGLSRVKKCTLEGRAKMSLDLQALTQTVVRLHPAGQSAADAFRLADDYVKAFYVPLSDLPSWAAAHSGYASGQVVALAACIAESSGLRRREQQLALSKVEAELGSLGLN